LWLKIDVNAKQKEIPPANVNTTKLRTEKKEKKMSAPKDSLIVHRDVTTEALRQ
jgi:hypothetical protein